MNKNKEKNINEIEIKICLNFKRNNNLEGYKYYEL